MKNNLTTLANTNIAAASAVGNTLPLKRIMVLETNWPNASGSSGYTGLWAKTPSGQEQELLDVRNMLLGLPQNDGEGVMWWYPESVRVTGFTGYQNGVTALFDNTINHAAEPAITDAAQNPFAPIRGDFNGDGHFNAADIAAMENALSDLNSYQTARSFTNPDMEYLGDFNGDGVINNADLQGMINALLSGDGSTPPSRSPPPVCCSLPPRLFLHITRETASHGRRRSQVESPLTDFPAPMIRIFLLMPLLVLISSAFAEEDHPAYHIDLRQPPIVVEHEGLKLGGKNSAGDSIAFNNFYMEQNGKPVLPVIGEFHYVRTPAEEWDQSLKKMKAAGVNIVSTYVFWNVHEPTEGKFDWSSSKDLRRFIQLCGQNNLQAIVR